MYQFMKLSVAAIFVFDVLVLAGNAVAQQMQMPPAQVEVVTAEERLLAPLMDVSATVISVNDSRIAAEVEGPLIWIAKVGTEIEKGDVIARIDDRLLKIRLRSAAASVARLKADMAFREREVERFEELAKRDNTSKSRLQEVVARREMLRQDIVEAEANLEQAKGDLARAEIRAPFPGHVVARLANSGEYINIGTEVARLVDTQDVEIAMAAPIAIAEYLKVGAAVTVSDNRKTLQLPIRTIVPVGDSISRMMEVRLSIEAGEWVIGAPVKVKLPKGTAVKTVAVPRDALILKGATAYIFKVGADMKAEQISADRRATVGLWVAVSDQVKAGDQIVVRGGERLTQGQSVLISTK